jgi:hypothetical protein
MDRMSVVENVNAHVHIIEQEAKPQLRLQQTVSEMRKGGERKKKN